MDELEPTDATPPADDAPDAAPGSSPLDLLAAVSWGSVIALALTPFTVLVGGDALLDPLGLGGGSTLSVARVGLSLCAGATALVVLGRVLAKRRPSSRLRPLERAVVTAAPCWVAALVVACLPLPLPVRFFGVAGCGIVIPYRLSYRLNAHRPSTAEDAYTMYLAGALAGLFLGGALSVVGAELELAPHELLASLTVPACTVGGSVLFVWISYRVSAW